MKKRRFKRVLLVTLAHLAIGAALALALAAALASSVDPVNGSLLTAETFTPETESRWSLWRWDRAGATCVVSTREAEVGAYWVSQVCGPANSTLGGDASTAWCPQNADAPGEWLELTYPKAVLPAKLRVFENSGPGTVARVTVFTADGTEVDAWRRTEPPPSQAAGGIANITLFMPPADPPPTNRVKLYLNTAAVPSWNEIDAVELIAADGTGQWASSATASSAWNRPAASSTSPPPESLVPKYGTLPRSAQAQAQVRPAKPETRCLVGYGWPMTVIYGEADLAQTTGAPGGAPAGGSGSGGGGGALGGAAESAGAGRRLYELGGLQRSGAAPSGLVINDLSGGDVAAGYIQVSPGGGTYVSSFTPTASLTAQSAGPLPGGIGPGGTTPLPRPRRIHWPGLAVNALLFATVIATGRLLFRVPGRFVREVSRLRSGRCIGCGYDLGYDFARGCPECGWRRPTGPTGPTRDGIPLGATPGPPPHDVRAA